MASPVRVRVELKNYLKDHSQNSAYERDVAFKKMHMAFKREVKDTKVVIEYKQRQFFESPSEKRKRKRREAEAALKLRDNFTEKKKDDIF
jgi:ribosomal protein S21